MIITITILYLIIGLIYATYTWRKYLKNPNKDYQNKIWKYVDYFFAPCMWLIVIFAVLYTILIGIFD
jgi:general stress protein CsbA